MAFKAGDKVFIVNGKAVREAVVKTNIGGFCSLHFPDSGDAVRLRENSVFPTKEAAEEDLKSKGRSGKF